jgi:hypothetical protein
MNFNVGESSVLDININWRFANQDYPQPPIETIAPPATGTFDLDRIEQYFFRGMNRGMNRGMG